MLTQVDRRERAHEQQLADYRQGESEEYRVQRFDLSNLRARVHCHNVTDEPNPYSPAIEASVPVAEQIPKRATWAAALGVFGLVCMPFAAPFAVYLGHSSLRRIREFKVGFEHRGAAQAGAILGWLGSAVLVYALVAIALELGRAF